MLSRVDSSWANNLIIQLESLCHVARNVRIEFLVYFASANQYRAGASCVHLEQISIAIDAWTSVSHIVRRPTHKIRQQFRLNWMKIVACSGSGIMLQPTKRTYQYLDCYHSGALFIIHTMLKASTTHRTLFSLCKWRMCSIITCCETVNTQQFMRPMDGPCEPSI